MAYLKRSGRFVTPGDKIGSIEEFKPGRGTYEHRGVIYSQTTGHIMVDREKREVNVFQRTKTPPVPKKGNIVVGEVQQVQDKMVTLRLFKVGRSELKKPFTAIIHVSLAIQGFLRSIHDAFKPGDLIRAQVVGDENRPFQLTTVGRELGVIQASCSRCGSPLIFNRRQLTCRQCGTVEKRKLSEKYGEL